MENYKQIAKEAGVSIESVRELMSREMLYKHGIALSCMKLERATSTVYFLRANRIEKED